VCTQVEPIARRRYVPRDAAELLEQQVMRVRHVRSVCLLRARTRWCRVPRRQRNRSVIAMARCVQLVQALRLVCRSDSDGGNGTFAELVCQKQILAR
jgi:hypothetical protein